MLCCNSCYDFKVRYDSVADQIVKLSYADNPSDNTATVTLSY